MGSTSSIRLLPDTFGNMGQTPQMMQLANLRGCLWTRVKPIGFDNQVLESDYSSQYSEMWWEGPDQTKIFGLLLQTGIVTGTKFLQKKAAIAFWKQNWLMWNVTLPQTIY